MTPAAFRSRPELTRFLLIMVAVYTVWFLVYDLWLLPDGRVDAWLSRRVTGAAGALLGGLGFAVEVRGNELWLGQSGIQLVSGCNGLSVLSLFVGFVLAFPGAWSRRIWFIPFGVGVLVMTNILRCAALLLLLDRSQVAFDRAHGGTGLLLYYAVVFALWVLWANVGGSHPRSPESPAGGRAAVAVA